MKKKGESVAKSKKKKTSPAKASKKPAAKSKPVKKVAAKSAKKSAKTPVKKSSAKPVAKPAAKPVVKSSQASTKSQKMDFSNVFTPLDDRLLVIVEEIERKTAGGLVLPDTVVDSSGNFHGRVVSVGRGRRDKKGKIHPIDVSLGDQVVFSQYTGNKIKLMDQNLVILREADVMGVVTK